MTFNPIDLNMSDWYMEAWRYAKKAVCPSGRVLIFSCYLGSTTLRVLFNYYVQRNMNVTLVLVVFGGNFKALNIVLTSHHGLGS